MSDIPKVPNGYSIAVVPSPVEKRTGMKDPREWYQATAPDGTSGCAYSSPVSAAQTAYNHYETGRWAEDGEYVTGFLFGDEEED